MRQLWRELQKFAEGNGIVHKRAQRPQPTIDESNDFDEN